MNPENFSSFYTETKLGFDLKIVEKGFKEFSNFFSGNTCLELGPASGYMTKYLVKVFDHVTAVEGSESLVKQIPNYSNLKKVHSLFENFKTEDKFNTIILNHVLEHIHQPVNLLKEIKKWKTDNGRLIVGVPNAKSFHRLAAVKMGLLSSEYELNERDHELGHYRVYDFESLEKDCLDAGFNIVHRGGIFIKFLSNNQIEILLDDTIIDAYFELGNEFIMNSAEIFLVLE